FINVKVLSYVLAPRPRPPHLYRGRYHVRNIFVFLPELPKIGRTGTLRGASRNDHEEYRRSSAIRAGYGPTLEARAVNHSTNCEAPTLIHRVQPDRSASTYIRGMESLGWATAPQSD